MTTEERRNVNWTNVPPGPFHMDNLTKSSKKGTPLLAPVLDFRRENPWGSNVTFFFLILKLRNSQVL